MIQYDGNKGKKGVGGKTKAKLCKYKIEVLYLFPKKIGNSSNANVNCSW